MTNTGLLIVTNPTKVSRILPVVQQYVNKTLYVQYFPNRQKLLVPSNLEVATLAPRHGQAISGIYCQTNTFCQNLDVRVLLACTKNPNLAIINTDKTIDIVIFDKIFNHDDVRQFLKRCLGNVTKTCTTVTLENQLESSSNDNLEELWPMSSKSVDRYYDNIVVGGTFDRLHAGHKLLLSEAALRCTSSLTIGVTDRNMVTAKKLWELIEPCEMRMKTVREFLLDIDSSLNLKVVPINDPFGPTKDDASLQLIVVSEETAKGGQMVNALRERNGLQPLEVLHVGLLNSDVHARLNREENEEEKISSSNQRLRLLGTRIRPPQPRPHLEPRPYIIGLTGGIASGKSTMSAYLATIGAGIISCDTLAHNLYKPGQPLFNRLREEFGERIVTERGEIDRKALGAIVFSDKCELEKLNRLVWPALLVKVKEEVRNLLAAGKEVVVVEAAVLLQAGWMDQCHEVWTSIIPVEEAVQRLQRRDGLTEDEARKRVAAQPSNSEQIAVANVVVTTLWSVDYTRRQLKRAWDTLQADLKPRTE